MERSTDKRATGKLKRVIGIGGIRCACCTWGPKSVTKRHWNRLLRARVRREILAEMRAEGLVFGLEVTAWGKS